jgi:hypothetical protein
VGTQNLLGIGTTTPAVNTHLYWSEQMLDQGTCPVTPYESARQPVLLRPAGRVHAPASCPSPCVVKTRPSRTRDTRRWETGRSASTANRPSRPSLLRLPTPPGCDARSARVARQGVSVASFRQSRWQPAHLCRYVACVTSCWGKSVRRPARWGGPMIELPSGPSSSPSPASSAAAGPCRYMCVQSALRGRIGGHEVCRSVGGHK